MHVLKVRKVMSESRPFYIIMGPPGSGKGTQSQYLADRLGLLHISSGDLLREAVTHRTPLGTKIQALLNAGQLVSNDLVWKLVRDKLLGLECSQGCILDGFPRTLDQAVILDEFLQQYFPNYQVIQLNIAENIVVERICSRFVCPSCQRVYHKNQGLTICSNCSSQLIRRSDDTQEVVAARLKSYHTSTTPLIEYYTKLGRIHCISAKEAPEVVFQNILNSLSI